MENLLVATMGILIYIVMLNTVANSITIPTIKGNSDPVAGQPDLALPSTRSCTLTILRAACDSWGKVFEAPFSLPPDCGNPEDWSRVILNLQGSVNGVQYDRYGVVWINGIEVLRLTTPEPNGAITSWSLQKDISYTLTYLINNQNALSMYLTIPNNVDSTYNGVYYITLSVIVYTSDQNWPPITQTTQLVPLTNAVYVNSASPLSPLQVSGNQTLTYTVSIEDFKGQVYATDGIHVQIFASAHGCEEFYYSNAPSDYASSLGVCGGGVYREIFVEIDGLFAGAALPFPVIYTGGINPLLWRPLTGIYSFNIPPYSIDISPFLGILSDGNQHQLSVGVFNNNPNGYWLLDAAFLLSRPPLIVPTITPTKMPTSNPSAKPSTSPTVLPSISPSGSPVTTITPITIPSHVPSNAPPFAPTITPSTAPSDATLTSTAPIFAPIFAPTITSSIITSDAPSTAPSFAPIATPSTIPSEDPSDTPSATPSLLPSGIPSNEASVTPVETLTSIPTEATTARLFAPSSASSTAPTSSTTTTIVSTKRKLSGPNLFPIPLSQARISSGKVVFYDNTTPNEDVTILKPSTSSIGFHTEGKHWYEIIGVIVTTDGRVVTRSTRGALVLVNQNDFSGETGHTEQLSTGYYASTLFAEGAWYEERQIDVYPLDLGEFYTQNNVSMEIKAKLVYSYNRWSGWTIFDVKKMGKSNIVEKGSLGSEEHDESSSVDFGVSEAGLHWGNALASNATYSRALDGSSVFISKDRALEEYHIRDPINYKLCYNRFLAALNGKLLLDEVKGNVTTSNCNYPSGMYFCGTDLCGQTPTQGYTAIIGYGLYEEKLRPVLKVEKVQASSSSRHRESAGHLRRSSHIRRRITDNAGIESGPNVDLHSESNARPSLGQNVDLGHGEFIYLPWSMTTDKQFNAPFIQEISRIRAEVGKLHLPFNIDNKYYFEVGTRNGLDINKIKLRQAEVHTSKLTKTSSLMKSQVDLKLLLKAIQQQISGRAEAFKAASDVDKGRNRHTAYAEEIK